MKPIKFFLCWLLFVLALSGCAQPPEHVHQYTKTTVPPTCTQEGYSVYLCACSDTYTADPTPAIGHDYKDTVISPDINKEGYTLHCCSRCNDTYQDAFTPPSAIMYASATEDFLLPLEDFSWQREHDPEFVLIHFCSAVMLNRNDPYNYDAVRSTFITNEVSVHYLIDREGTIYCFVPENLVAWHAGKGEWMNDEKYTNKLNHYAIGIELMAIGSQKDMAGYMTAANYNKIDPTFIGYTDAQYASLRLLVQDICRRNNIPMDRQHVFGHDEYASRKTDPGELFDWSQILPD